VTELLHHPQETVDVDKRAKKCESPTSENYQNHLSGFVREILIERENHDRNPS